MHRLEILKRALSTSRLALGTAAALLAAVGAAPAFADDGARPVKVMIINMFSSEAGAFTTPLNLTEAIPVRGLSPDYPNILCNSSDVCQMIAGEGHANVAASTMALVLSEKFDLRRTYFLIAGIAGIDPKVGTTGSAAWARYLIDYGISWEIDAREIPSSWPYGYLAIFPTDTVTKPWFSLPGLPTPYHSEMYQLSEPLLQKILSLTGKVDLTPSDNPTAKAYRARYTGADQGPGRAPPSVIQCDTMAGDTWFHGTILGERAEDWTKLWTGGKGVYCTTQQEDNATYMALSRGALSGLVDLSRVAVLRTASNFDRPYPGEAAWDSLCGCGAPGSSGGFVPAVTNLWLASAPFINDVVANWTAWKHGVPK